MSTPGGGSFFHSPIRVGYWDGHGDLTRIPSATGLMMMHTFSLTGASACRGSFERSWIFPKHSFLLWPAMRPAGPVVLRCDFCWCLWLWESYILLNFQLQSNRSPSSDKVRGSDYVRWKALSLSFLKNFTDRKNIDWAKRYTPKTIFKWDFSFWFISRTQSIEEKNRYIYIYI